MYNTELNIKVKAKLFLYSTENGGRNKPIHSGYRPNHVFEYVQGEFKQTYIGQITFSNQDSIYPGEAALVDIEFVDMLDVKRFLHVGRKWWIHEVNKKLGEAEIIEILE